MKTGRNGTRQTSALAGWPVSWWLGATSRDECRCAVTWWMCTAWVETGGRVEAPLELARHLVWGAVDYARELGFEPHPDFQPASAHLGAWRESSDITFGRDGVPFYVSGPFDNPVSVTRTLNRSVGEGNFHYMTAVGAAAGW